LKGNTANIADFWRESFRSRNALPMSFRVERTLKTKN